MSDTSAPRKRDPFGSLWPWPGNLFLLLLAIWLVYMGTIAHVQDVKTAFYGLGTVTVLTLLLGLRTAIGRRREGLRGERSAPQGAASERRRSAISSTETTVLAAPPARGNVRPMYPSVVEPQRRDDIGEAIIELETALNRDRAERGAQIVKLEHVVATLAARLDRTVSAKTEDGDGDLFERVRALEMRLKGERPERVELAQLTARLGALELRGAPEPDLGGYLKTEAFDSAIGERLGPRVQQMIVNALRDRPGPGPAHAALAVPLAQVHEAPRGEVATQAALRDAGDGAELERLRSEVAELRAAITARGEEHVGGGIKRRIAAAEAALGEMRQNLAVLGQAVARAEANGRDVLARLEALAVDAAGEPSGATDVATLRDALTDVIEQTRAARARKETPSDRLDPAPRVGIGPTDRT